MCLLTYFPEGIQPNVEALAKGARANSDGHGFAIVIPSTGKGGKGGRILVRKSMQADGLIKEFAMLRALYPDGPAMFHSRITTDGITDLFNCHPFMVGGDKRTILGHNGILPSSARPGKKDKRSDTRIFAEVLAKEFKLTTLLGRQMAGEWMGTYNKMVILTVDPAYHHNGYIINESQGSWNEGIWYSNGTYKGGAYRSSNYYNEGDYGSYTTGYGMYGKDWEYCPVVGCKSTYRSVSPSTLRCVSCKACCLCEIDPCECVLVEVTKGKGQASPLGYVDDGEGNLTVVGSPRNGATVRSGASTLDANATSVEDYREALQAAQALSAGIQVGGYAYDRDPEDDPADAGDRLQLAEVLALVDHLNNGGDLEDLPLEEQQRLITFAHDALDRRRRTEAWDEIIAEFEDSGEWPPDEVVEGSESHAEPRSQALVGPVSGDDLIKSGDVTDDQESAIMAASVAAGGLWNID